MACALDYAQKLRQRRCLIFLLSDFLCDDFTAPLKRLASRHEIVAIGVSDPAVAVARRPPTAAPNEAGTPGSALRLTSPLRASSLGEWRELPDCGLLNLRDPETGNMAQIDTASIAARSAPGDSLRLRRESNAESIQKAGVDYLHLNAEPSYMNSLIAFLRRRVG